MPAVRGGSGCEVGSADEGFGCAQGGREGAGCGRVGFGGGSGKLVGGRYSRYRCCGGRLHATPAFSYIVYAAVAGAAVCALSAHSVAVGGEGAGAVEDGLEDTHVEDTLKTLT
eukprot:1146801-Pelagomonas_calceolata.AAC.1